MTTHLLLLALVAVADPDPATKGPTFKVETRGANAVVAQAEKDRTVFVVTSERGMGWADIALAKGDWPEHITFRFRYAEGKGFSLMESFELTTDRLVAREAVKSFDSDQGEALVQMKFAFLDAEGKPYSSQLNGKNHAGTLDLRVQRQDGGLEVVLPARMLRGSSKLGLGWIDFYRR